MRPQPKKLDKPKNKDISDFGSVTNLKNMSYDLSIDN
jgi:hypothetical protein